MAPGQAVDDNTGRGGGGARSRRRGMRLSPLTIGIAAFLTLASIGLMALVLGGVWPPKPTDKGVTIEPTPHTPQAVGVIVEKAGAPRREGDNVIVPLKVTNKVKMSAPVQGTQPADAPTPTAGPTDLYNASIKVIFYKVEGGKKVLVGSGVGNATDLAYNQSKQIEVWATPVGDFTDYEAYADTVTSKASLKSDTGSGDQNAQPSTPANPTP
jgi:hypothetical protein